MNRPVRSTVAHRPVRRPSLTEWVQGLPGLSGRARQLLLEGDTEGRYAGRTAADSGYRLTMALAVAVSQPGREWTLAPWWEALVLRPTAGGAWARSLRSRKGERYAEGKLAGMLDKARTYVGTSGTIVSGLMPWWRSPACGLPWKPSCGQGRAAAPISRTSPRGCSWPNRSAGSSTRSRYGSWPS